jgi:hypothetical protein
MPLYDLLMRQVAGALLMFPTVYLFVLGIESRGDTAGFSFFFAAVLGATSFCKLFLKESREENPAADHFVEVGDVVANPPAED